ncbi:MAG: hypothetical protein NT067_03605 [Candidatus Diapherotrites archaeon]|nr:hypothetical protein [Candidatus Diapherotrites archaeon]
MASDRAKPSKAAQRYVPEPSKALQLEDRVQRVMTGINFCWRQLPSGNRDPFGPETERTIKETRELCREINLDKNYRVFPGLSMEVLKLEQALEKVGRGKEKFLGDKARAELGIAKNIINLADTAKAANQSKGKDIAAVTTIKMTLPLIETTLNSLGVKGKDLEKNPLMANAVYLLENELGSGYFKGKPGFEFSILGNDFKKAIRTQLALRGVCVRFTAGLGKWNYALTPDLIPTATINPMRRSDNVLQEDPLWVEYMDLPRRVALLMNAANLKKYRVFAQGSGVYSALAELRRVSKILEPRKPGWHLHPSSQRRRFQTSKAQFKPARRTQKAK